MAKQTDYFLGIGQGEWSARWLSKRVKGVKFHPAPNYLQYSSAKDFEKCATEWVKTSIGSRLPAIVLAESQAAPALTRAIKQGCITAPPKVILVQPLGLNPASFGSNDASRRKALLKRSKKFWQRKSQNLTTYGNFMTFITILFSVIRNPHRLGAALVFAANQDIRQEVEWLSERTEVYVIAADKDDLFPYGELKKYVPSGVVLQRIEGAHVNRATQRGVNELKNILRSL